MTKFDESRGKVMELVDDIFMLGIEAGYNHGVEVCKQKDYKRGYDNGYKDGYNQGFVYKDSYQRGLDDAWECAKKICANWVISDEALAEIFGKGKTIDDIMLDYSATEAIVKIKEYEEKQTEKSCENCEHGDDTDSVECYECVKNIQNHFEEKPIENDCEYRKICLMDGTFACRECQNKSNFRQKPYLDYVPYHSNIEVEFDEETRSYVYTIKGDSEC